MLTSAVLPSMASAKPNSSVLGGSPGAENVSSAVGTSEKRLWAATGVEASCARSTELNNASAKCRYLVTASIAFSRSLYRSAVGRTESYELGGGLHTLGGTA